MIDERAFPVLGPSRATGTSGRPARRSVRTYSEKLRALAYRCVSTAAMGSAHRPAVVATAAASGWIGPSATQADFASRRSLETRTYHTRLALPWNTLLAGLVWIIQIVPPWGGST